MNKLRLCIFIPLIFGFSLHGGEIFFKPEFLHSKVRYWPFKQQYYRNYYYKNSKIVFQVVEVFTPLMERLIVSAKENGGQLVLKDNGTIYFDSSQLIEQSFRVQMPDAHFIDLDPESLKLSIASAGCFGRKEYWLGFYEDDYYIKINQHIYDELVVAKKSAKETFQLLRLDYQALARGNSKSAFNSLVQRNNDDKNVCVVCFENEKCIMLKPCHHVVLCEGCAAQIEDKCPVCRQDVTKQVKVFY